MTSVIKELDPDGSLLEVMKSFGERERTILTLYYYEQMNYKEIAQLLNITVERVSTMHYKCLEQLKNAIKKMEEKKDE